MGRSIIEYVQKYLGSGKRAVKLDAEAWSLDTETFNYLLLKLADLHRVVILSGDVHYGFGSTMVVENRKEDKIINFVSSSLSNQSIGKLVSVLLSMLGHSESHSLKPSAAATASAIAGENSAEPAPLIYREEYILDDTPAIELDDDAPVAGIHESLRREQRGTAVVGSNNFGEIYFTHNQAIQKLHWIERKKAKSKIYKVAFPHKA